MLVNNQNQNSNLVVYKHNQKNLGYKKKYIFITQYETLFIFINIIITKLQVGITSFGIDRICGKANYPSVFIEVSSFYEWILDKTKDASYCQHPIWRGGEFDDEENLPLSPNSCTINHFEISLYFYMYLANSILMYIIAIIL